MDLKIVSFDPLRSFNIPNVRTIKAENWLASKTEIQSADWIIYPEYWQVNSLVYGFKKSIFPNISSFHLGHNKIEMTRILQAVFPEHVPYTLILPNTPSSVEQILDEFAFPIVGKAVKSSMGQGVYLIKNRKDLRAYTNMHEVLYIQEYLPITRDLRVVQVGSNAISAYWREASDGQFHNNVAQGGMVNFNNIPPDVFGFVETVSTALGIDHAGFDIAIVDNHFYILEFNIRFGTQGLAKQGIPLHQHIYDYLLEQTFQSDNN